jgi:hypothetical protein
MLIGNNIIHPIINKSVNVIVIIAKTKKNEPNNVNITNRNDVFIL